MYKTSIVIDGKKIIVSAKDVDVYGLTGVVCKTLDGDKVFIDLDTIEDLAFDAIYDDKYNRELG